MDEQLRRAGREAEAGDTAHVLALARAGREVEALSRARDVRPPSAELIAWEEGRFRAQLPLLELRLELPFPEDDPLWFDEAHWVGGRFVLLEQPPTSAFYGMPGLPPSPGRPSVGLMADLAEGRWIEAPGWRGDRPRVASAPGGIGIGSTLWLHEGSGWTAAELVRRELLCLSADLRRALLRSERKKRRRAQYDYSVVDLTEGAVLRWVGDEVFVAPTVCWEQDRVVWRSAESGAWSRAPLAGGAESVKPVPALEETSDIWPLDEARVERSDGVIVDLEGDVSLDPRPYEPARCSTLSRDATRLLGVIGGSGSNSPYRPVVTELDAGFSLASPTRTDPWHPRADLLLTPCLNGSADDGGVIDLAGATLATLPGAAPLSWRPDGLGLIALTKGALQLWAVPPASGA